MNHRGATVFCDRNLVMFYRRKKLRGMRKILRRKIPWTLSFLCILMVVILFRFHFLPWQSYFYCLSWYETVSVLFGMPWAPFLSILLMVKNSHLQPLWERFYWNKRKKSGFIPWNTLSKEFLMVIFENGFEFVPWGILSRCFLMVNVKNSFVYVPWDCCSCTILMVNRKNMTDER